MSRARNPAYLLLPYILLGFLLFLFGCGRDWSIRGSSFPQERAPDRPISEDKDSQGRRATIPSSPAPMATREGDEITRRAEDLRRAAEKLAQEAGLLGERAKAREEGETSSPKEAREGYPGRSDQTGEALEELQSVSPLSDVFFAYNESLLSEEAQRILEKNAEWLRAHPEVQALIEGHCDERGTVEYNLALGERRAQSVKDHLINLGVSEDRLLIISYGKERPFALGATEEAWAQNRRGHFVLRSS